MILLFWIFIFIVSLFILVKSADYFIGFSERLGLNLGIPQFIIGVTIISIGTSLPELISSLIAVFKDSTEIVAGNVVGSNIANILLIIGLTALFAKKLIVERDLIDIDLPLLASATAGLVVVVLWDGKVSWQEGIVALLAYSIYLLYTIRVREKEEIGTKSLTRLILESFFFRFRKKEKVPTEREIKKESKLKLLLALAISGFFIWLGAEYTIRGVIEISRLLNIGTSVIALSAIAIGTSLPELAVSLKAVKRKNYEIALGNVFGSNIFNGSLIIGFCSLFKPLVVSSAVLAIAVPFLIISTLLYIFSGISRKIYHFEGAMYLLIYILFIGKLFGLF
jgi:cation:H+ antiporter